LGDSGVRNAEVDSAHVERHFHDAIAFAEFGVRAKARADFAAVVHASSLPAREHAGQVS
jgi:hypothetical protein